MLCPSCKETDNKVIDSRLSEGGVAIRRRRVCLSCNRRFTTKERVEEELRLTVIKAGGQRVPYNRENVLNGVARACSKLDIREEQLQELVDHVEEDIFSNHDREVKTEDIGRYVGMHLRRLNPVAYVRFMSVHRKYNTVDAFIEEISDVRVRAAQESPDQGSLFETSPADPTPLRVGSNVPSKNRNAKTSTGSRQPAQPPLSGGANISISREQGGDE